MTHKSNSSDSGPLRTNIRLSLSHWSLNCYSALVEKQQPKTFEVTLDQTNKQLLQPLKKLETLRNEVAIFESNAVFKKIRLTNP